MNNALLAPATALVAWTLVMLAWTAGTRFPAMARAGVKVGARGPGGRGQDLEGVLPAQVNWKAHNHTHLHEQPTLFYAVVAILTLAGAVSPLTVGFAWAYVALRVVHSIWQATVNTVPVRFMLFALSSLCLAILVGSAVVATF